MCIRDRGERVIVEAIKPEQHFTQPPPRDTEATLVKALEENGIGRPSTYAPTVSVIQAIGYVGKEKKALYPTELGRIVNEIMKKSFSDIVNVEFTAQMEENLDKIEQGNKVWVDEMCIRDRVWEDASNKISYGERKTYFTARELHTHTNYVFRSTLLSFLEGSLSAKDAASVFETIRENYPVHNYYAQINMTGSHDVERLMTCLLYTSRCV